MSSDYVPGFAIVYSILQSEASRRDRNISSKKRKWRICQVLAAGRFREAHVISGLGSPAKAPRSRSSPSA